MKRNGMAILLTDKCTASCDVCGLSCSPKNNSVIDENLMLNAIQQAKEIGNIIQIGFSGGEVFLFPELLKKGVNFAKKSGFRVTAVSNGFWGGKSDAELDELLKDLPLDLITFSCDLIHQKYIPYENIIRAVSACERHKINTIISVGEMANEFSAGKFLDNTGTLKYQARFNFYKYIRVGKAVNFPREKFLPDKNKIKCCNPHDSFTLRYDGEIFPCCSPAVFNSCLSLGNIKNNSIKEILSNGDKVKLCQLLMIPSEFMKIIDASVSKKILEPSDKELNSCEICQKIFNKQENFDKLHSLITNLYDKLLINSLFI